MDSKETVLTVALSNTTPDYRHMRKKFEIEVRQKGSKVVLATIKRKLQFEAIGNFCPAFCMYLKKQYLVKSEKEDLSDPFRANDSYLKTLFIEVTA